MEYFSCPETRKIQLDFASRIAKLGNIDLELSPVSEIREVMFSFFSEHVFVESYMALARVAAELVGLPMERLVLQSSPTPRIFRPNQHGTSFHCDYWYGHGLTTYTIWTPLTPLVMGNSFQVCMPEKQEELYEKIVDSGRFTELEDDLMRCSFPVLPQNGASFIFNSRVLHGSPKNTSNKTRLSFDFRIGESKDDTSSKDLANYYHFESGKFFLPRHPFQGKRVLKYICGGDNRNTFAQHALIEETAKRYEMDISEQEAEIERYGYPMLRAYLDGDMNHKKLDGIIAASETIFDGSASKAISASPVPVWCALENKFLK